MRRLIIFFLILSTIYYLLPTASFAQVDPNLPQRLQQGPIIVDHDDIILFDQIPQTYLTRAKNIGMLFSDRSVGVNTNDGLSCLAVSSWISAPAHCRRDYTNMAAGEWKTFNQTDLDNNAVPDRIYFAAAPGKYDRSNWFFEVDSGTWSELTQRFIQNLGPNYINSADVLSYQFSYLNVDSANNIANPSTGFFANTSAYDIYDLENYWAQHPNKVFVLWTTSLARNIGTSVATNFNQQMRSYVNQNHLILLDFADIESHRDAANGYTPCTYNGHPVICQDYTTESAGGHLGSVSAGKIMVSKGIWVLMAQIAGWQPDNPTYTPPPVTNTPVPSNTPTPVLGDLDTDGDVDILDALHLLFNFNSTSYSVGDFNQNGRVDIFDINTLINNL